MSKTTITFKIGSRKNSYGVIESPRIEPVSESDRILAQHLLGSTNPWYHRKPAAADGTPGELDGNLQQLITLAEAHGWDVKFIHDPESEVRPHPLTFDSKWIPSSPEDSYIR